jgi:hypothetical protein
MNTPGARVAFNRLLEGGSNVTVKTAAKPLLPGESVQPGEKLMYKFYFRTSRFNTLQEKTNALTLSARYFNALIVEGFTINTYLTEPFDEFEINGLYKDGRLVMKPLLALTDPFTYSYHTTLAMPGIYNLRNDFSSFMSGLRTTVTIPALNRHGKGYPPKLSISVSESSSVTDGIEQWQIENEASRNPAYNSAAGSTPQLPPGVAGNMTAVSGALGGSSLPSGFSFTSSISATPASNFTMTMGTSAYVWGDFTDLKNSVSRALSYQVLGIGPYVVRDALNTNPSLRTRVNSLMLQNMATYRFTRGTYGVMFRYQYPRGNTQYTDGTSALRTFTY